MAAEGERRRELHVFKSSGPGAQSEWRGSCATCGWAITADETTEDTAKAEAAAHQCPDHGTLEGSG